MQYLKENVKQKIINSALAEFRKSGYQGAAMRDIAANANIVSGNIYRYFKNKEDLFDCTVEPAYQLLKKLELSFQESVKENHISFISDDSHIVVEQISAQILEVISEYETEMTILLEYSEGTKYADTRENLKQVISNSMRDNYLVELKESGKVIEDDFIFEIVSSSFVDGICLILKKITDSARIKRLIDSWIDICFFDLHQRV